MHPRFFPCFHLPFSPPSVGLFILRVSNGWIDERAVTLDHRLAVHPVGADILITYAAMDTASWLKQLRYLKKNRERYRNPAGSCGQKVREKSRRNSHFILTHKCRTLHGDKRAGLAWRD